MHLYRHLCCGSSEQSSNLPVVSSRPCCLAGPERVELQLRSLALISTLEVAPYSPLLRRDGGVEAVIDRDGGFMASREVADVYATEEPQAAFHARVAFCLDIHNEVRRGRRHKKALQLLDRSSQFVVLGAHD